MSRQAKFVRNKRVSAKSLMLLLYTEFYRSCNEEGGVRETVIWEGGGRSKEGDGAEAY